MDGGKFYVGHLLRVPVYIGWEALFLVFFAYRQYQAADPQTILLGIICIILVILLHEFGHALVALALRVPGVAITISAMGGYCSYLGEPSPSSRILITAAGPLTNFLLFGASFGALLLLTNLTFFDFVKYHAIPSDQYVLFFLQEFCFWNLLLGCLNSFPLFPLDGGQLTLSICTKYCQRLLQAKHITLVISVITAAAMVLLILLMPWPPANLILVAVLLMVAFTSLSA